MWVVVCSVNLSTAPRSELGDQKEISGAKVTKRREGEKKKEGVVMGSSWDSKSVTLGLTCVEAMSQQLEPDFLRSRWDSTTPKYTCSFESPAECDVRRD